MVVTDEWLHERDAAVTELLTPGYPCVERGSLHSH